MSEKRYRMETIGDVMSPFIVDNTTAKKNGKFISYHTYETHSIPKCLELVDLLNNNENLINELYNFRLMYNALLFNEWSKQDTFEVYKSKRHYNGELCFDGEWFIVVAILPTGQITNHYSIKYWDYFQIKEYPQVKDEFDGHDSSDVLNRLYECLK